MPSRPTSIISTDRQAQHVRAVGQRTDFRVAGARNLLLRVTSAGTRSWCYLFVSPVDRRRRKITIGRYPELGLAGAKKAALALAASIGAGIDPLHRYTNVEQLSFGKLAESYLDDKSSRQSQVRARSAWIVEKRRLLTKDVLPVIGARPAHAIIKGEIAAVVQRVASRGSFALADKVLGVIRSVYQWGISTGRLDVDPTLGLKKQHPSRARERTLSACEIERFWEGLEASREISASVRDCLKLQLLLGLRIGEATGAARDEVNLSDRTWVLPAKRTKSNRELRLPLPDGSVSILLNALTRSNGSPWLFPSMETDSSIRPKSASRALLRLSKKIGLSDIRTHDLRRTCATGLGELDIPDDVIERVLNHAPRTVTRRHYNHAKNLEAIRLALTTWDRQVGNIVGRKENSGRPP